MPCSPVMGQCFVQLLFAGMLGRCAWQGSLMLMHGVASAGTTGCTSNCPGKSVLTLSTTVLQPAPAIPGQTLGWAVLNARGLFHQNW